MTSTYSSNFKTRPNDLKWKNIQECVLTQYAAELWPFLLQHYLFNTHTAVVLLIAYEGSEREQTNFR